MHAARTVEVLEGDSIGSGNDSVACFGEHLQEQGVDELRGCSCKSAPQKMHCCFGAPHSWACHPAALNLYAGPNTQTV